jgi:GH24 family phage-related lysozyme (muramidase)
MIDQLREELEADEGVKYEIYLDHLDLKTCGVGHLCRKGEPEYDMEVGTPVSEERVAELFEKDIGWTMNDCLRLLPDFDMLPEQVRLIFANMMFNMGRNRLAGFVKFIAAIESREWQKAAVEMADSKWARQVPNRSGRLIERMRGVS